MNGSELKILGENLNVEGMIMNWDLKQNYKLHL